MKFLLIALVIYGAWVLLRRATKPAMPADEAAARRTLGVSPRAGADKIRAAHRRLVSDAHPDRGGSAEDTRALNAARDLLLERGR